MAQQSFALPHPTILRTLGYMPSTGSQIMIDVGFAGNAVGLAAAGIEIPVGLRW
jgi:hypothetical protein